MPIYIIIILTHTHKTEDELSEPGQEHAERVLDTWGTAK